MEECGHGLYCLGPYPTESSSGARCVPLCATLGGDGPVDFCAGDDDQCVAFRGSLTPNIGYCEKSCEDWLASTDCDFGDRCTNNVLGYGCNPSRQPPALPGAECTYSLDCGVGLECFGALEGVCPGRAEPGCCGVLCDYTNPTDTSCADAGLPSAVCVPLDWGPPDVPPEGYGVCSVL